jgi:Family of unknown function (DUF6166)
MMEAKMVGQAVAGGSVGRPVPSIVYLGLSDGTVERHRRHSDGTRWTVRPLNPRFDLENKSPTGFAWGYGGSGPAQLALALLADTLGDDERALRLYQAFKFRVIARLPMGRAWTLTQSEILDHVFALELERLALASVIEAPATSLPDASD